MTAQPRDHRGRFLPAMSHEDAARMAMADEHIEPVSPSAEAIASLYRWPVDPVPQEEIDAEERALNAPPTVAFIVLIACLLSLLGIAIFMGSLL